MRHDPAGAAIVVMLRSLKMYGMAQAAPITELFAVPRPREKPPATLPSGRKRAG
jgi:hypothetical protein